MWRFLLWTVRVCWIWVFLSVVLESGFGCQIHSEIDVTQPFVSGRLHERSAGLPALLGLFFAEGLDRT